MGISTLSHFVASPARYIGESQLLTTVEPPRIQQKQLYAGIEEAHRESRSDRGTICCMSRHCDLVLPTPGGTHGSVLMKKPTHITIPGLSLFGRSSDLCTRRYPKWRYATRTTGSAQRRWYQVRALSRGPATATRRRSPLCIAGRLAIGCTSTDPSPLKRGTERSRRP